MLILLLFLASGKGTVMFQLSGFYYRAWGCFKKGRKLGKLKD